MKKSKQQNEILQQRVSRYDPLSAKPNTQQVNQISQSF